MKGASYPLQAVWRVQTPPGPATRWLIDVLQPRSEFRDSLAARFVPDIKTAQWKLSNSRHAFALSRPISPELCFVASPSGPRGRREGRVPAAPAVHCAHIAQRKPHSSIQVKPNTRPSLRSGWTAYAALSQEPSSF
jgi:hypothetical protein